MIHSKFEARQAYSKNHLGAESGVRPAENELSEIAGRASTSNGVHSMSHVAWRAKLRKFVEESMMPIISEWDEAGGRGQLEKAAAIHKQVDACLISILRGSIIS